jgi:hypothetical protein
MTVAEQTLGSGLDDSIQPRSVPAPRHDADFHSVTLSSSSRNGISLRDGKNSEKLRHFRTAKKNRLWNLTNSKI